VGTVEKTLPLGDRCTAALMAMEEEIGRRGSISRESLEKLIELQQAAGKAALEAEDKAPDSLQPWPGAAPRTPGQTAYVQAMLRNDLVFCIGPAGTGKTFLAVAVALHYLRRGKLNRIVLCRPAVEAGENLGYLPGDMHAKVNPYLRPLYDALHDLMDARRVRRYVDNDIIEILPLAFVRGRTLDEAFIILDEAQNCTAAQMKTFLTRLGAKAKLVVTGDITQVDLPPDCKSGLIDAQERLPGVAGIRFVWLDERDIVRHPLVRRILNAYQQDLPDAANHASPAEERDSGPE